MSNHGQYHKWIKKKNAKFPGYEEFWIFPAKKKWIKPNFTMFNSWSRTILHEANLLITSKMIYSNNSQKLKKEKKINHG